MRISDWSSDVCSSDLHLVFVPTGSAAPDHYGGDERKGHSYYGVSVVELDSRSGAVRWMFQTVHHDLCDSELAAQPVNYLHDGKTTAVLAATKLGVGFLTARFKMVRTTERAKRR